MNDFFTINMLQSYAGAVLATTLITQMLKGIELFNIIPTRIFSYIIAVVILLGSTLVSGAFTLESAFLSFINAVVVSLASNGAYDAINSSYFGDAKG